MLQASAAQRFAAADRDLVDGLAFPEASAPSAVQPAGPTPTASADRAARLPSETVTP
jgi:hypothetical protein